MPQFPWGEAGLCVPMGQQGGSHSPPPPSRVGRELREIQQNAAAYPAPWAPSGRARGARLSRRPIAAMPSSAAAPAPWGAFWPLRPDPEVPLWGRAHGGQLRTPPAKRASRVQLLGRAAALPSCSPPVPPRCVINIQPQRCAQPSPISCLTLGGPRCTELRGRFCLGGGGREGGLRWGRGTNVTPSPTSASTLWGDTGSGAAGVGITRGGGGGGGRSWHLAVPPLGGGSVLPPSQGSPHPLASHTHQHSPAWHTGS